MNSSLQSKIFDKISPLALIPLVLGILTHFVDIWIEGYTQLVFKSIFISVPIGVLFIVISFFISLSDRDSKKMVWSSLVFGLSICIGAVLTYFSNSCITGPVCS